MKNQQTKSEMARELGRSGGLKTLEKHGKDHYKKIIKKRWENEKRRKEEEALQQSESEVENTA